MKNKIATGCIAVGLLFGGACSSDGGSSDAELIQWFEDEGESPEAAACFAKELSNYSVADLDAAFNGDEAPTGSIADDAAEAGEACADL